MTVELLLKYILQIFLMPPGLTVILFVVAWMLHKHYKKTAITLALTSFASLYVLSLPLVADKLIASVETTIALTPQQIKKLAIQPKENRAIVVLSAGRVSSAAEYDKIDIVNPDTLQRIHYASRLQKRLDLPVLLSGGRAEDEATAEAVLMNQLMVASFGNQPRWIESDSQNTKESAKFTADLLNREDINEIVLVTHAWHMPRAKRAFENEDLVVIEAPTAFKQGQILSGGWLDFFPNANALVQSNDAIYEMFVTIW